MEPKQRSVDEFFNGLPEEDKTKIEIVPTQEKKPAEKAGETVKEEVKSEEDEPRKNRRHRRLEEQLQKERELRIAAEARAEGRSEVEQFSKSTATDEVDSRWLTLYGDTPQSRAGWKLNQELFSSMKSEAKEEAWKEMEQRQIESVKEEREAEAFIDSQLESIEDEHNVDITSNSPAARKIRTEFLDLVQKLSPKDETGSVTDYADFQTTWEVYQTRQEREKPDNSRQKEIASRSMAKSGSGPVTQTKKPTPGFRGWEADYNL